MILNHAITTQIQLINSIASQYASISTQFTKAAKVGNLQVTPVLIGCHSHSAGSITPQLPAYNSTT